MNINIPTSATRRDCIDGLSVEQIADLERLQAVEESNLGNKKAPRFRLGAGAGFLYCTETG